MAGCTIWLAFCSRVRVPTICSGVIEAYCSYFGPCASETVSVSFSVSAYDEVSAADEVSVVGADSDEPPFPEHDAVDINNASGISIASVFFIVLLLSLQFHCII